MERAVAIRQLFLQGQPSYSLPEAAELIGWSITELSEEIAAAELSQVGADTLVTWQTVATLAVTEWSPEMIEDALGANVTLLPELARLGDLCVRLPRYQIVALETAARRHDSTLNEFLSRYLLDQTSTEAPTLGRTVDGFQEAYMWPQVPKRQAPTPANFTLKLVRPGFGPAAELPTSSPA